MNTEFVTVSRSDREFQSLLMGTFDLERRAIPVGSFNVNSTKERVTFQIVPLSEVSSPKPFWVWFLACRPEAFTFFLMPFLVVTLPSLAIAASGKIFELGALFVALLSLHCAFFLWNDYSDYVSGVDRLRPIGGSQVLRKGWLTAKQMRRAAHLLLVFSCALGFFVILNTNLLSLPFAFIGVFVGFSYSHRRRWVKQLLGKDILIFLCFGPLLLAGLSLVINNEFSLSQLALSGTLGLLALIVLQVSQLENLMYDSLAGVENWMTALGFDRSKKALSFEVILAFVLGSWVLFEQSESMMKSGIAVATWGCVLFYLLMRVVRASSPFSSSLRGLGRGFLAAHATFGVLWLLSHLLSVKI